MKKLIIFLLITTLSCSSAYNETIKNTGQPRGIVEGISPTSPSKFLFKDANLTEFYEVTIDSEKYIYIFNRHDGAVSITKKF